MAIIARDTGGNSGDFEPAPAGAHQAVCVDVVDKGLVTTEWQGKVRDRHLVQIRWQINERMTDGTRYLVTRTFTLTLHEKGQLRPFLESWRGRAFTREELEGFDLERLIGANCQINVVHRTNNDRTYANVVSIMPPAKGTPRMEPENYTRVVDREDTQQPVGSPTQSAGERWPEEKPDWLNGQPGPDLPF